jgi:NAD(P)-dependent dehydrogenase (short-subunit alcohol dehydrogenase family)
MREEMEVNVYGSLAMTRAFASILRSNGGGAIVNVLSMTRWFTSPLAATYSATNRTRPAGLVGPIPREYGPFHRSMANS